MKYLLIVKILFIQGVKCLNIANQLSEEEYNLNEKVLIALDFLLISGKSVLVTFWIQGCSNTCLIVSLFEGFLSNKSKIKFK